MRTRARLIEEAVTLVYDSLQSHLPYTHKHSEEGRKFHRTCVKEYARVLTILSKLY